MTRKQRKQKRLNARRRNFLTMTVWERRFQQRKVPMLILGFIGAVVMHCAARLLGLGFPERPALILLGYALAAGLSMFLRVKV